MSKKLLVLLFVALTTLTVFGKEKLHIYSWSDYIPDNVIEQFEAEFDCKVIYDTYDSNESMYAKLRAGAGGYDIAFPSGDYVSIMIKEHMLEKIEINNLENFKNLDPKILKKMAYDPEHEYGIPYMMGSTGIAVNTKYLQNYPRSWKILNLPEIEDRVTLLDDMREVFGAALKSLGYSINTIDIKELIEAKDLIMQWEKKIAKFDNELFAKGIISGEFYVVHGYAENIFLDANEQETKDIDFFIPEEGGTLWIDNMVILKNASNMELAYSFIDFVLRAEISANISSQLLLPSPNIPAQKLLEAEPVYTMEELENCEMINDLGENLGIYNEFWNEIRFGL